MYHALVVQENARSHVITSLPIGQAHVEQITSSLLNAGGDPTQNAGGDPTLTAHSIQNPIPVKGNPFGWTQDYNRGTGTTKWSQLLGTGAKHSLTVCHGDLFWVMGISIGGICVWQSTHPKFLKRILLIATVSFVSIVSNWLNETSKRTAQNKNRTEQKEKVEKIERQKERNREREREKEMEREREKDLIPTGMFNRNTTQHARHHSQYHHTTPHHMHHTQSTKQGNQETKQPTNTTAQTLLGDFFNWHILFHALCSRCHTDEIRTSRGARRQQT